MKTEEEICQGYGQKKSLTSVMCQVSVFFYKVFGLVGGGSVIKGAYPV